MLSADAALREAGFSLAGLNGGYQAPVGGGKSTGGEEKTSFRWYQVGEIVYHRSHLFFGDPETTIDFLLGLKMVNSKVQFIFVEVNSLEMVEK